MSIKSKKLKERNAGPLDTESLYYPLDEEDVTLKDSLYSALIR